jgi:hypothetical protein
MASACYGEDREARVRFVVIESPTLTPAMTTVRFTDGSSVRTVTGSDFRIDDFAQPHTPWFSTRTSGSLEVDIQIDGPASGATVSEGRIELPLQNDWRWEVHLHFQDTNPVESCLGCFGYQAFSVSPAFQRSLADSLYVVWGGNSISNPAVY